MITRHHSELLPAEAAPALGSGRLERVDGALGLQLHMFERTQARGVCTSDQTPGSRLHPGPHSQCCLCPAQHQLTLNYSTPPYSTPCSNTPIATLQ